MTEAELSYIADGLGDFSGQSAKFKRETSYLPSKATAGYHSLMTWVKGNAPGGPIMKWNFYGIPFFSIA